MPFISIKMVKGRSAQPKQQFVEAITEAITIWKEKDDLSGLAVAILTMLTLIRLTGWMKQDLETLQTGILVQIKEGSLGLRKWEGKLSKSGFRNFMMR